MHNSFQERIAFMMQPTSGSSERDLIKTVALLHKLRYHIMECFKYALEEIETNPAFSGEVMYVPKCLCEAGKATASS